MRAMRAAVVDSVPGTPTVTTVEIDDPGPDEVLVRIVACGVCHSDVASIDGTMPLFTPPFVLGHEPAGVVEAVGTSVKHIGVGQHVVVSLLGYCGHCPGCSSGQALRCTGGDEAARGEGSGSRLVRDGNAIGQHCSIGGFAEFALVGKHNVIAVDEALPLTHACLLGCGVMTGMGAVLHTSPVAPGQTVVVLGCGGVGLAVIQAARLSHAGRIVAVDLDEAKIDLAVANGATDCVNAAEGGAVESVLGLLGAGADHVFEAIGRPDTAQDGLGMLGLLGTLTMVGLMSPTEHLTVSAMDLMMGKSIHQSLMGSGHPGADIPLLARHALSGRIDLGAMVSAVHPLDAIADVTGALAAGQVLGRAVIAVGDA